jgi:hypothetical protein
MYPHADFANALLGVSLAKSERKDEFSSPESHCGSFATRRAFTRKWQNTGKNIKRL